MPNLYHAIYKEDEEEGEKFNVTENIFAAKKVIKYTSKRKNVKKKMKIIKRNEYVPPFKPGGLESRDCVERENWNH